MKILVGVFSLLYIELFTTFLLVGAVSFGGGYAMIPLIQQEVVGRHAWMTMQQFADVIAIAGMSPGPIGTNSAIYIGYAQAGIVGALVSTLGMVLPSLLIILGVGMVFERFQTRLVVRSAFYGVRPIITGLIVYAALTFALHNGIIGTVSWFSIGLFAIFLVSLGALIYLRIHPLYVILLSGILGAVVYG
jgi:chromate transporter